MWGESVPYDGLCSLSLADAAVETALPPFRHLRERAHCLSASRAARHLRSSHNDGEEDEDSLRSVSHTISYSFQSVYFLAQHYSIGRVSFQ